MIDHSALAKKYPPFRPRPRAAFTPPAPIAAPPIADAEITRICAMYGVTREDVLCRSTQREHASARITAYAALAVMKCPNGSPLLSLDEIAAIFGRNRTTVIKGLQRIGVKVPTKINEAA